MRLFASDVAQVTQACYMLLCGQNYSHAYAGAPRLKVDRRTDMTGALESVRSLGAVTPGAPAAHQTNAANTGNEIEQQQRPHSLPKYILVWRSSVRNRYIRRVGLPGYCLSGLPVGCRYVRAYVGIYRPCIINRSRICRPSLQISGGCAVGADGTRNDRFGCNVYIHYTQQGNLGRTQIVRQVHTYYVA